MKHTHLISFLQMISSDENAARVSQVHPGMLLIGMTNLLCE
uniref:Uncharacterized protein n=1 Tax=Arundo donax TaxID=35708 RepID=A0A0A9HF08_ARUDO